MPSPEIRPATEADLSAVTDIYEHAVLHGTATFELIPPDLTEMTRRFRALMDGGPRTTAINLLSVMRGLDPRIHHSSQESYEEDGLPGQARQ